MEDPEAGEQAEKHEPSQYPPPPSAPPSTPALHSRRTTAVTPASTPVITLEDDEDSGSNEDGNSAAGTFPPSLPVRTSLLLSQVKDSLLNVSDMTSRGTRVAVDRTVRGTRDLSISAKANIVSALAAAKHTLDEIGSVPLEEEGRTDDDDVEEGKEGSPAPSLPKVKGEDTDGLILGIAPQYIVPLVAVVGFFSGLASFVIVVGHVVDLASVTLVLLAPLVLYQRKQLSKLGSFRMLHNETRRKVNRLHNQNIILSESVSKLETHVESLASISQSLENVARQSEASVEELVSVVEESREVQNQMTHALMRNVMQDVLTTLLRSDRDQNLTVEPGEVKFLEMRLQSMPGIVFHPDRFHSFLASDEGTLTVADVCALVRHLKNAENLPEDQRVVTLKPDSILAASSPQSQPPPAPPKKEQLPADEQWEPISQQQSPA